MIVTDLKYHLENRLIEKLDIMIKRCTNEVTRKDSVLVCEGAEGEGKTNSSEAIAYYAKSKMDRPIHMFFRLKPLIEFAKNNENMIIIWDEPALDSLSTDWWRETNKDLIRLLMTCRKKRHFFIFNFVKFYKFSEYVIVDRSLGLIHMYSRRGVIPGRFIYVKLKNLENLFIDYRTKKKREYKKYMSFGGSFPIVEKHLGKMGITIEGLENATLEDYERLKDKAIASIGQERKKTNVHLQKYNELKKMIGGLKYPIKNQVALAELLNVNDRTIYHWKGIELEDKKFNSQNPESRTSL